MNQDLAIYLTSQTMTIAFMVSAPMLFAGLIVGVAISIFQAVTQINEMTLSFIPKILVTGLALVFFFPWMATKVIDFFHYIFELIPVVAK
jgi:flagellar biosynthesis protein FliQ